MLASCGSCDLPAEGKSWLQAKPRAVPAFLLEVGIVLEMRLRSQSPVGIVIESSLPELGPTRQTTQNGCVMD